jgi:hypothetical protein
MRRTISFRCLSCNARLRAPAQLQGLSRNCPGCGRRVTVPSTRIQDAGPVLVFDDRRFSSNVR